MPCNRRAFLLLFRCITYASMLTTLLPQTAISPTCQPHGAHLWIILVTVAYSDAAKDAWKQKSEHIVSQNKVVVKLMLCFNLI